MLKGRYKEFCNTIDIFWYLSKKKKIFRVQNGGDDFGEDEKKRKKKRKIGEKMEVENQNIEYLVEREEREKNDGA